MIGSDRPSRARDVRLFLLLIVAAAALLVFLLDERSRLGETRLSVAHLEEKLAQARGTILTHREILLPPREKLRNPRLLAEKSLRTIVMEATAKLGIPRSLESIDPTEDKRTRSYRARLSLNGVTLRQVVEFILSLKGLSAGIRDSEGTLRMIGYNRDSWRLDLTLEAPLPATPSPGSAPGPKGSPSDAVAPE
ncbi:MAG: hypothetical protein JXP34_21620 [Planctomycetes bacterium]|nr:hypothetical protein [Planctomycetota bacterium]